VRGMSGRKRSLAVLGAAAVTLLATAAPATAAPPAGCAPRSPAQAVPGTAGLVGALLGAVAGRAAPAPVPCPPPAPPAGTDTSAATRLGWGRPVRVDEFDGTSLGPKWNVYDGPGHAGNGRRTPKAVSVRGGILTITGDAKGNTAGMEWGGGQKYGRWEGRVKAPASDPTYNALLLLWPDAENFPVGGEIDFMEMMDHTRQETNVFLHYGKKNRQVSGEVRVDATQWHDWAVEWTPTHVATFLDGKEWWRTERTDVLPPGPMHLCVQLDWFPGSRHGTVRRSTMQVDWVKQYALSPKELGKAATDEGPVVGPRPSGMTGAAQRAQSGSVG
jgi:Glycosyl hydrolases family 16